MTRIPEHIGIIPDGNRRWAVARGLMKQEGYAAGLDPGLEVFRLCKKEGVKEVTFYGFTQDNTKRPAEQRAAFQKACIDAVMLLSNEDADLLVLGNTDSDMFPSELKPYTTRTRFGKGGTRLNFLVNYSWQWDMSRSISSLTEGKKEDIMKKIYSWDISRVDMIIRWGGRRRLSGFLPIQSVYSDFYVIDDYWSDFTTAHFYEALEWYSKQDITLGG